MSVGALIAGLVAGPIMERLGRKRTLGIVCAGSFFIGNSLIAIAPNVHIIMVGRFVVGFAIGMQLSTITVYILEIATTDMKGILGCFVQGLAAVGIVFTFCVSFALDWKYLALVSALWAVPYSLAMYFVPDSPRWLMAKGKQYSAKRSLEWLRGKDNLEGIEREMELIRRDIEKKKRQRFSIVILAEYWKPFLIALMLMFFLNTSGFNILVFYPTTLFQMVETKVSPAVATMIIGFELLISCILAIIIVAKLNRRFMLIFSVFCMALCQFLLGLSCYQIEQYREHQKNITVLEGNSNVDMSNVANYNLEVQSFHRDGSDRPAYLDWLPLASVLGFVFLGNVGFGTLIWIVTTELLPPKVRGMANSIIICIFFACGFLVAKTFVDLIEMVELSGTIWIYAGFCLLGFVFTFLFVPETSHKPDDDIQRALNRGFFQCVRDAFTCNN